MTTYKAGVKLDGILHDSQNHKEELKAILDRLEEMTAITKKLVDELEAYVEGNCPEYLLGYYHNRVKREADMEIVVEARKLLKESGW